MQRLKSGLLFLAGLWFLIIGWGMTLTYSQDDTQEFAGARECLSCHRSLANAQQELAHARTLIDTASDNQEAILGDFESANDRLTLQLPSEDEARPMTASDIAYILGVGRNRQAYVVQTDADQYLVLPFQWNTTSGKWESLELAESFPDPAYDFTTQCAGCHTTNYRAETLTWGEAGVQCEACHGPAQDHVSLADDAGSVISDRELAEITGTVNFALDAQVCGQCHIRGSEPDGIHPFPIDYTPGDDLLSESIFIPVDSTDEAHFFPTGHAILPNMQLNEWLQSSHPQALITAQESDGFGAECLVCHSVAQERVDYLLDEEFVDPDEFDPLTTLDQFPFGVTCASCHNPHETENATFLREEPYPLCTSCHSNGENEAIHHPVQEIYEGLALIDAVEPIAGAHFTADEGPTCTTCHMQAIETKNGIRNSHTFHPVSPVEAKDIEDLQDACTVCHTDIEDADQMQNLIDSIQSNVTDRVSVVREGLADDAPQWVSMALDAIEGDGSLGIHNFAYTHALLRAAETELGIAESTVTEADVSQRIAEALPPIDTPEPEIQRQTPQVGGLTAPSVAILGIAGLIFIVAAYSFFIKGGRDE